MGPGVARPQPRGDLVSAERVLLLGSLATHFARRVTTFSDDPLKDPATYGKVCLPYHRVRRRGVQKGHRYD